MQRQYSKETQFITDATKALLSTPTDDFVYVSDVRVTVIAVVIYVSDVISVAVIAVVITIVFLV